MAKYEVNWETTPAGNGIKEGEILTVSSPGAIYVGGAIYKGDFPVLMLMPSGQDKASIKIKRADLDLKGPAVLKVEIYSPGWLRNQINDDFIIF